MRCRKVKCKQEVHTAPLEKGRESHLAEENKTMTPSCNGYKGRDESKDASCTITCLPSECENDA